MSYRFDTGTAAGNTDRQTQLITQKTKATKAETSSKQYI
jgi:hypothetical protein